MTFRIIPAALCLSVLAACATGVAINTPPQQVSFSTDAARNNIYAQKPIEVRAQSIQIVNGSKKRAEITGAACAIKGTGYTAQITTPAKVNLPTYKGRTDPVTITCKANGQTATKTFEPYNETTSRQATVTTGGLAAVLVTAVATAAVKAARNPANDVYAYHSKMVVPFETQAPAE